MAVEKLSDGIRKFYADARKLEEFARAKVTQQIGRDRRITRTRARGYIAMTPTMTQPRRMRLDRRQPRPRSARSGRPGPRSRRAAQRGRAAEDRRLLAGEQLPRPRDDVPEGQPAPEGAAQAGARQGPAARPLGRQPGPGLRLHPPEPGDQGPRPGRGLHGRSGARRPGVLGPCYLEGRTPRCTRTAARTRRGCSGCSSSSPSPAGSAATRRRRRPARSTRAANSGTSCRTPAARRSTTRT